MPIETSREIPSWQWWVCWTALAICGGVGSLLFWILLPWSIDSRISLDGACAIWIGGIAFLLLALVRLTRLFWRRASCVLHLLFLFWLFYGDGDSRLNFCRDLKRVQIGMTRSQAKAVMVRWELRSEDKNGLGYGHSNDGAYNADAGGIDLKRERVARVRFSPD